MYEDEIAVGQAKDLRGQKFGNLTILYRVKNTGSQTTWKYQCDCGEIGKVTKASLDKGQISCRSCAYKRMGENKIIDLKNQKFGRLTVIGLDPSSGRRKYWKCICDCGNEVIVDGSKLKSGHTQSCGCLQKEKTSEANGANLIGEKFGFLTVLEQVESKNNQRYWKCICDCGNLHYAKTNDLMMKKVQSCGCKHESFGVIQIKKLLIENQINFITEHSFNSCRFENTGRLAKFDFYIENKYLLEFDGEQHFQESNQWFSAEGVQRDNYKNQWCKENNIPLIRIPYTHLDKLCLDDLKLETTQFRII